MKKKPLNYSGEEPNREKMKYCSMIANVRNCQGRAYGKRNRNTNYAVLGIVQRS